MSVIKPRSRGKQVVRHIARLDVENNELLFAYAKFLGEPTDYVMNQLLESVLAKDKDFLAWRTEHPESCVPPREPSRRRATHADVAGGYKPQGVARRGANTSPAAG